MGIVPSRPSVHHHPVSAKKWGFRCAEAANGGPLCWRRQWDAVGKDSFSPPWHLPGEQQQIGVRENPKQWGLFATFCSMRWPWEKGRA